MKQITIYEFLKRNEDILCGDYVAMDKTGDWKLYGSEPEARKGWNEWLLHSDTVFDLSGFSIAPFDGDWKDSLIKVERSKKRSTDRKDFDDFIEQHGVSPYGFLTEAILKEDFECWKKRRKNDKDTN